MSEVEIIVNRPIRLLHVTDTHLIRPGGTRGKPDIDAHANLANALAGVAAERTPRPDVIVHTGDITDDGSLEATTQVYGMLNVLTENVSSDRVMLVAGNHDLVDVVASVSPRDVVTVGPWRIVRVDTVVPGAVHGELDVAALARALDAGSGAGQAEYTVIAMHHPIRSNSIHPWFTLATAGELEAFLETRPDVRLVMSGHTHERFRATLPGGCILSGGPSTYYSIEHDAEQWRLSTAPTGVTTVVLHPDGRVEI